MPVTTNTLASHILALLPTDGTPILNRVMRVMLARDLAAPVTPEGYFKATDRLVEQGKIGRSRGQGGSIFYTAAKPTEAVPPRPDVAAPWSEASLMPALGAYLSGPFRAGLGLPSDATYIVKNTANVGPTRGRWARPDFILVSAMRFRLLPGCQVDVHSFELKNENGATDLAVYEALAQTRFTHFGHLVWHLPRNSPAEVRLPDIERQCEEHGVGLIRFHEPDDLNTWQILLDPVRKPTLPAIVDGLLEARLDALDKETLGAVVKGAA